MSRRDDLNKLLTIKQRRLQKLNEQAALDAGGPSTGEGARSRPDQLSDPPATGSVTEPGGGTREDTPADRAANLREQLNQAFDEQALAIFCLERYPAVYKQFRAGMSKQEKIQRLVRYCENQGTLDQLAATSH